MCGARVSGVGEFVAVSAFRSDDPESVLDGVHGFVAEHAWTTVDVRAAEPVNADDDVLVYPPVDGWTVVLWPQYWTPQPAAEFVSRRVGGASSSVRIHDGDYWTHTLVRAGVTLDRFASMPDYDTDDPAEISRLAAKFAGQPAVVAEALDCPVERVAPYLAHVMVTEHLDHVTIDELVIDRATLEPRFPDDEFEPDSPWLFVDFWRHAGITYPPDVSAFVARLRLAPGWSAKLPTGDAEF